MSYAIYLRKSRADAELERRGEGETLSRHRAALFDLAERQHLEITAVYEEIVSGDSVASRPQMQKLLQAVGNGKYAGVLVMEIERLARGDTMDQGLVAQTFKYSGTKIITPIKTYDPNDEFDEEFFEFGLFMSRREYNTIKRRLKRGLYAAANEGRWISPYAPYGYRRVPLTDKKGHTLEPVEEQAAVVRLIYTLYLDGLNGRRLGLLAIAKHLNELSIPAPRSESWQPETIRAILNNPAYAGKVRYGYRKSKTHIKNGEKTKSHPVSADYQLSDGLHPPLISYDTFLKAQQIAENRPIMPVGYKKNIKSPLSGLIRCKLCDHKMTIKSASSIGRPPYLCCPLTSCPNVSAPISLVEERLIASLTTWISGYELSLDTLVDHSSQLSDISILVDSKTAEVETVKKQLSAAYDLLEQGIYSAEVFNERTAHLSTRLKMLKTDIAQLSGKVEKLKKQEALASSAVPRMKNIIDAYRLAVSPAEKNALLQEILDKAVYYKEKSAAFRDASPDDFSLDIYPKLPDSAV